MICPLKWAAVANGLQSSGNALRYIDHEILAGRLQCDEEKCGFWTKATGQGNCAIVNMGNALSGICEVMAKTNNKPIPKAER